MKIKYLPQTDTMFIHLKDGVSDNVVDLTEDIAMLVDKDDQPLVIEIYKDASKHVDLAHIEIEGMKVQLDIQAKPAQEAAG
jgi:uncharacterized protein YuzE